MNTPTQLPSTKQIGAALVAILLVVSTTATASAVAAGTTTVSIAPSSPSVDVGETETVEIVVENADGGVGAAEVAVAVDDPSVVTITDVSVVGSAITDIEVAGDGSSADLEYFGADTADTGAVPIVEVTVEGQADGATGLSLVPSEGNDDVLVFDEEGTGYDVTGTTDATLTVGDGPSDGDDGDESDDQTGDDGDAGDGSDGSDDSDDQTGDDDADDGSDDSDGQTDDGSDDSDDQTGDDADDGSDDSDDSDDGSADDGQTGDDDQAGDDGDADDGSDDQTGDDSSDDSDGQTDDGAADGGSDGSDAGDGSDDQTGDNSSDDSDDESDDADDQTGEDDQAGDGTDDAGDSDGGDADDGSDDQTGDDADQPAAESTYYQVDLAVGEPIEELGPDREGLYSDQSRLVEYLHGSSEDPVTRQGSPPTLDAAYADCVTVESMTVEDGQATATFTVAEGCEYEFSLVSYEKPDDGWSRTAANQQTMVDAETGTYGPGTHTVTVDLPGEETTMWATAPVTLGGPAGLGATAAN
jgi:hypothetical protein